MVLERYESITITEERHCSKQQALYEELLIVHISNCKKETYNMNFKWPESLNCQSKPKLYPFI